MPKENGSERSSLLGENPSPLVEIVSWKSNKKRISPVSLPGN